MAKTPTPKKPRKAAAPKPRTPTGQSVGRPAKTDRTQIAARLPNNVLVALDARAVENKISRNDALIQAAVAYGKFPDDIRPVIAPEGRSVGERVKTSDPEPLAPGARLDKAAIGKRTGPPIAKSPVPVADEEGV